MKRLDKNKKLNFFSKLNKLTKAEQAQNDKHIRPTSSCNYSAATGLSGSVTSLKLVAILLQLQLHESIIFSSINSRISALSARSNPFRRGNVQSSSNGLAESFRKKRKSIREQGRERQLEGKAPGSRLSDFDLSKLAQPFCH